MKVFGEELTKTKQAHLSAFNTIDPFAINWDEKYFDLYTDAELVAAEGKVHLFDCESYGNYFLAAFRSYETKKVVYFEDSPDQTINLAKLRWIMEHLCVVGFNSTGYDVPVIIAALHGWHCEELKVLSNRLIREDERYYNIEREYNFAKLNTNHIDLIEVAPLKASLKLYGGRLHAQRMQELNIDPDRYITKEESKAVRYYCINDLDLTGLLYENLKPALELRYQLSTEYNIDLRSKSDAQIAEAVIGSELRNLQGYYPKKPKIETGTVYRYKVPSWLHYETPELQRILETIRNADFIVSADGAIDMPPQLNKLTVHMGECLYRLGIGGLHSSEENIAHKSDDQFLLIDKDVASYYPAIILNLGLTPHHLGKNFLKVYKGIVERRLEAKKVAPKGVIEQSLKITINGSFGKLGNKYSVLYSPDLLIQVTMTGQLALLLLIEYIESINIRVVSANTDGILIRCPRDRYNLMESMVIHWQQVTGFDTEESRYKAIYHRDVNNYIAITEANKAKVKGCYAERGSSGNSPLSKNPESFICNDAVIAFLTKGTPIEETVKGCTDIRRFVTIRTVKGGAEKSGVYLGKAIRWYYSNVIKGEINYVLTGNKVANSTNAMPCQELPSSLPSDLDFDYYIKEANNILKDIGYFERVKVANLPLF